MNHFEPNATQLIRNLWLGNYYASLDLDFLQKNNIRYIVNITTDIPCVYNHIHYLRFSIRDCQLRDRSVPVDTIEYLVNFIRSGLNHNCGVLVHCKHGHHRSASIVLAYLLKYTSLTFDEGCRYIQFKRPRALMKWKYLLIYVYYYYLFLTR